MKYNIYALLKLLICSAGLSFFVALVMTAIWNTLFPATNFWVVFLFSFIFSIADRIIEINTEKKKRN